MGDVISKALSSHFSDRMWELYYHHGNEVGSKFRGEPRHRLILEERKHRSRTNCVIYVYNVLIYGYTILGRNDIVGTLKSMLRRQDGIELAKYLVGLGWNAHYWNPDVYKPRDGSSEHVTSFTEMALHGNYYGVNLSGLIVGYNKQEKFRTEHRGLFWPFGEDIKVSTEDPENLAVFEDLKKVKFAVGLNRGATHCFCYSMGEVFEVHWDKEGPDLYGKLSFFGYNWCSGILLTPPDSTFSSRSIADVKAKMR